MSISNEELKNIVKEGVKEVLQSEAMKVRAFSVPSVSDKEQEEIEEKHGKSPKKEESGKEYFLEV